MAIMLKTLEKHLNIHLLKEDIRKLGVNFITAGTAGLFITHIVGLTFLLAITSLWVIFGGILLLVFGLYKQKGD
jgi:hypothetical protein